MLLIFKKFSDVIKTNFDAQLAPASAMAMNAFDSAEKFSEVNMNAAKSAMQSTAAGKQLMSVKGPQEVLSLIASHTQPNVEEILDYGRNVVGIFSRSQGAFTKVTEAHITEMNRKITMAVEGAAKSAQAGSEHAIALVRSAIGNAHARYDQLSKTAYQAVDELEANLSMAASQFARCQGKARQRANREFAHC